MPGWKSKLGKRKVLGGGSRCRIVAYPVFFPFIVPVAFLTTVPAQAFLDRRAPGWFFGAGVLAIGLFLASKTFWQFAQRFYTSASS